MTLWRKSGCIGIIGAAGPFKTSTDLYQKTDLSRPECSLLARLRTRHCGLNYYLWRFKKEESAGCNMSGYEMETVKHFLLEGPGYWKGRRIIRNKVRTGNMKMKYLLGDHDGVKEAMRYVKVTRRFEDA
jgi:hypothetical protein